MARGGTRPSLSKAILMTLAYSEPMTARQAWRNVPIYTQDLSVDLAQVFARLEQYVQQGLVEHCVNLNGVTQYKLKVWIEFC